MPDISSNLGPIHRVTAPFEPVFARHTWRALLFVTVLAAAMGAVMTIQQRGLEKGVPNPIISFERARTADRSLEIRATWERNGELPRAWWNTWLDFLFIPAYTSFAVGLLSWATSANRDRPRLAVAGAGLAWLALAPAGFDLGENVFLLRILAFGGLKDDTLPQAAYWLATVKFGVGALLVVLGLPYAVWAAVRAGSWSGSAPVERR
jgi:hypothetical protein